MLTASEKVSLAARILRKAVFGVHLQKLATATPHGNVV